MPSFTTSVAKLVSSLRAQSTSERPVERLVPSAPFNLLWTEDVNLLTLEEASESTEIVHRPIDLLIPVTEEQPITHIEYSWSPLSRFVSLEEAQKDNTIRHRALNML